MTLKWISGNQVVMMSDVTGSASYTMAGTGPVGSNTRNVMRASRKIIFWFSNFLFRLCQTTCSYVGILAVKSCCEFILIRLGGSGSETPGCALASPWDSDITYFLC